MIIYIDFQKLNFTASSVGDIRKSMISDLLPCEIQFLKIYISYGFVFSGCPVDFIGAGPNFQFFTSHFSIIKGKYYDRTDEQC